MGDGERERLTHWLTLAHAAGIGPKTLSGLLSRFGDAEAVCTASGETLRAAGLAPGSVMAVKRPDPLLLERALTWVDNEGAYLLTLDDARYPPLLKAIDAPPPLLFVRGRPTLLAEPQIAIVGSRNPTPGGLETTRDFAGWLAGLGIVVTSGLAAGIDGAAHQGALETGHTIAVLGTGPDRVYPAAHRELARRIAKHGALVSEFLPGTGPHASHFPRRNRLISGLSLGTLVTEAAPNSGSLITARHAVEQGREVFAIPGSIHNPLARGCHVLIRQGAKLVDSAEQILEELAPQLAQFAVTVGAVEHDMGLGSTSSGVAADADGLEPEYRDLLALMGHDPVAPDELIARSGLPAQSVSSMLLLLELQGYVSSQPGGRYSRRGHAAAPA
jgi:DNA processing protein